MGGAYVAATGAADQLNRLCSADLPPHAAFFDPLSGKGFDGRIFMNGEERGDEGRGFAHIVTGAEKGDSYELPALGRFSWENAVPHPAAGDRTIVMGLDDSTPGQVYVYIGTKTSHGSTIERRRSGRRALGRQQAH